MLYLLPAWLLSGKNYCSVACCNGLFIKIFKSPWAGIIAAAFLFPAMHLQFYGFLPRFVLGILLGLIYWYSGSLWAAMIAHFVYDASLIILTYFNPEMLNDETSVKLSNTAFLAAVSFIIGSLAIGWMKRRSDGNVQRSICR